MTLQSDSPDTPDTAAEGPTQVRVSVLNYGAGNLGSVLRLLKALKRPFEVISEAHEIAHAEALIFPGVGSSEQAMQSLKTKGNDAALRSFANSGRPLLGICVGMQVLGEWSEEGNVDCLGILPYRLVKFTVTEPVPHMGWNDLKWNRDHVLAESFDAQFAEPDCYFVHSFYAPLVGRPEWLLAATEYAGLEFVSFVAHENVWGMQFHVEKSGATGLELMKAFCAFADSSSSTSKGNK